MYKKKEIMLCYFEFRWHLISQICEAVFVTKEGTYPTTCVLKLSVRCHKIKKGYAIWKSTNFIEPKLWFEDSLYSKESIQFKDLDWWCAIDSSDKAIPVDNAVARARSSLFRADIEMPVNEFEKNSKKKKKTFTGSPNPYLYFTEMMTILSYLG